MLQCKVHVSRLPFLPIRVRGIFSYPIGKKWLTYISMYHQLSNSGLAVAQHFVLLLSQRRREVAAVQTQAAVLLSLATSHGFPLFTGFGTYWHGWALAMQSQGEKGLPQIHQGMTTIVATGMLVRSTRGYVCWPRLCRPSRALGGATWWPKRIDSRASSCYVRPPRMRPRPKRASSKPWPWPAASKPNRGSCERL